MKKKVLVVLMSVIMSVGLLAGCGSGNGGDAEDETGKKTSKDSNKQVEITWMHHFQEAGIQAWIDDIIGKFQEDNPNIKIVTEVLGADSYDQTLKTKIASDDAPMIFDLAGYAFYKEYGDAGHLYDMSELEGLKNINPDMLPAGQIDGKQYAVSLDMNAFAVFYDKDIFAKYNLEVPTTTAEMKSVCQILLDNGIQPIAAPFQEQWCTQTYFDILTAPQYGDDEWWSKKMNLSSNFSGDKKFKELVEEFYSMKEYWGTDPFGTNWDSAQNMLANGEAAMIMNGSWTIDGVVSKNPDCNVGVFALPATSSPEGAIMQLRPGNGFCLYNSQDETKLEAGKKFLNYMMSRESGQSYANHASKMSTAIGVDLSFSEPLTEIQAYTGAQVWNSASVEFFSSEYQQLFYETLTNYCMEDSMDVDGLAKSLDQDFAAIRN